MRLAAAVLAAVRGPRLFWFTRLLVYMAALACRFIAGSHLSGRGPMAGEDTWKGKPAQSLLVKGGDCVIFVSTVWHNGAPNTSQDTRHMMQFHYSK